MPDKVKAAVLYGPRDLRFEEITVEPPGAGEALLKVKTVGVCGSDLHYYTQGRVGKRVVDKPQILGHEYAAEVVELGTGVRNLDVGDLVTVEPSVPCGACGYCLGGHYNLCRDMVFHGTPGAPGALRQFLNFRAENIYRVPEGLSSDQAVMTEPLSVAVHSVRRGGVTGGHSVAVLGTGPIGLLIMMAARAWGSGQVYTTEINRSRLQKARELGADYSVDSTESDPVQEILDRTSGLGVDVVFEAAGQPETAQQALDIVKPGGVVVLVGMAEQDVIGLRLIDAIFKEIDIRTQCRSLHSFDTALEMMARGAVAAGKLVTHRFPFHRLEDAFELVAAKADGVVKAVVDLEV
ncbi:zinc-binding dehydrogenase [candidate division KSB1 bacterium]